MWEPVTKDPRIVSRTSKLPLTAENAHVKTAWAFVLKRSSVASCGRLEGKEPPPENTTKAATSLIRKSPQYEIFHP